MATTATINSNYNGEVAGEIVGKAFKEADTISKGLITVLPNVAYKASLRKIEYTNGKVDYSCGFTPTGAVTRSEVELIPKKIKNEMELCKEDYRQVWSTASMGFSAHNDMLPADEEEAFLTEVLSDTAVATGNEIWSGDAATDGEIGGLIPLFTADANVIKANNGIVPLAAAIDKTNVVSEIEKVLAAVPVALRRKPDIIYSISPDIALAYDFAQTNPSISNGLGAEAHELKYGRITFTVNNDLPDNTFAIYQRKNVYFGTGLMSDHNEIRIKDMDETDLSGQVRFKMVYTGGVQYVNPEEIIWYLSTTAVV